MKLENLSKGKQQIDELINDSEKQKEEINQLNQNINTLKNDNIEKDKLYQENINNLNQKIKEINDNNFENENKYKQEIKEKDCKINEIEIEFKIKEKNKLIKELQDQLKKEVIKSQELKCKVLNLNDELIDIKQKNETLIIENERIKNSSSPSPSSSPSSSPPSSLNGHKNKNKNKHQNKNNNNNNHHHHHPNHHQNGKPSKFVEKEVSGALAKKLEIEVKSNFALKEQIKYLTESIQQLHIDLDNKKTVISNLTKRIDIGALPTSSTMIKNKKSGRKRSNSNSKQELIGQLQLLMQETTLQNAMLRKDLELMGKELEKSHNKIKTLTQNDTK